LRAVCDVQKLRVPAKVGIAEPVICEYGHFQNPFFEFYCEDEP
jgi:hypothetical protein